MVCVLRFFICLYVSSGNYHTKQNKRENGKKDAYEYVQLIEFLLSSRKDGKHDKLELVVQPQLMCS